MLSAEGYGTEIPTFLGTFAQHLLIGEPGRAASVALRSPILSEAVDLADLVRMTETLHIR